MSHPKFSFPHTRPLVVGSFGDTSALSTASPQSLALECDVAEIRLDLIHEHFTHSGPNPWAHLAGFPLLFTARRHSEGSPIDLTGSTRQALLEAALPAASLIDIEVASIPEMRDFISHLQSQHIPWIASYHNFQQLPSLEELTPKAAEALKAGAAAFKFAAKLNSTEDLHALAALQKYPFGMPTASMGMGKLAPVSRLLCAQHGSCLNYGYLGKTETAPGQWPAKLLREGIRACASI
jgi:3-dehydroquinate dehydratase-1